MVFIVNKAVKVAWESNEAVLMNLQTGKFYGLDQVGSETWRLIESGMSIDQIVSHLHKGYEDVDEVQLLNDIQNLLDQLLTAKLIKEV